MQAKFEECMGRQLGLDRADAWKVRIERARVTFSEVFALADNPASFDEAGERQFSDAIDQRSNASGGE